MSATPKPKVRPVTRWMVAYDNPFGGAQEGQEGGRAMTLPRLKLPWRWRIYGGLPALTCGWRVMVVCFPATTEQATKIARRHGALAE